MSDVTPGFLFQCVECGHLHFDGEIQEYATCPIGECECLGPCLTENERMRTALKLLATDWRGNAWVRIHARAALGKSENRS